jgi:magnesium chelatase family protein
MLSKCIATIMPPMALEEAIETTKIHSIAGLLGAEKPLSRRGRRFVRRITRFPMWVVRRLRHSDSGEVGLAHNGVLFLDELPEFKRSTLEVMRQPLEERDGRVTISACSETA